VNLYVIKKKKINCKGSWKNCSRKVSLYSKE